jgi:hypothetical protein
LRWCPSPAVNVDTEDRHSIPVADRLELLLRVDLVEQIATGLGLRLLLCVYLIE